MQLPESRISEGTVVNMKSIRSYSILAALCAFAGATPALGTTFCVTSAAGIQAALTTAQANGQDDTINIVAGSYELATGLTFNSTEAHSLHINGYYQNSQCTIFDDASTGATLDGNQLVRPLLISSQNGSVEIVRLNFLAGKPSGDTGGGGLLLSAASAAVRYSTFFGNRTTGYNASGAAAYIVGSAASVFADNLVVANHGSAAGAVAVLQANGEGYVNRNTIVSNSTDTLADPGGLLIAGSAHFNIANNIVWNNAAAGGSDFLVQAANTRKTNDIGIVTPGSTVGSVTGEVSVNPGFVPCNAIVCFTFELARSSPLVDAGTDGLAPSAGTDLSGKVRIIGPHTDIGAYENDLIFANGLQAPVGPLVEAG
jgi:hypothetical protein